jgi:hypothetical protein
MERSHFRLRAGEYDAAKEARDQCEKILDNVGMRGSRNAIDARGSGRG